MCVRIVNMKSVTTREAQHHLAKVLEMVEAGEEVAITRRGKKVAKVCPLKLDVGESGVVDWSESIRRRDEALLDVPAFEGSLIEKIREDERW